jgi:sortase A
MEVQIDGQTRTEWIVDDHNVGWNSTSARPGAGGNIVFTGHNDTNGGVFRRLAEVQQGDEIRVLAGGQERSYVVTETHVVLEKGVSYEQRQENGVWIGAFPDERVTMVTCYPPGNNTHRLIVVAKPANK